MKRRFGHSPGESNPYAKLTWEQVQEIRRRRAGLARGEKTRDRRAKIKNMADEFNVAEITIHRIVTGQIWKEEADGGA